MATAQFIGKQRKIMIAGEIIPYNPFVLPDTPIIKIAMRLLTHSHFCKIGCENLYISCNMTIATQHGKW